MLPMLGVILRGRTVANSSTNCSVHNNCNGIEKAQWRKSLQMWSQIASTYWLMLPGMGVILVIVRESSFLPLPMGRSLRLTTAACMHQHSIHYPRTMQDMFPTTRQCLIANFNLLRAMAAVRSKEVMAASGGNDHATRQLCKLSNKHHILSKQQITLLAKP